MQLKKTVASLGNEQIRRYRENWGKTNPEDECGELKTCPLHDLKWFVCECGLFISARTALQ